MGSKAKKKSKEIGEKILSKDNKVVIKNVSKLWLGLIFLTGNLYLKYIYF